MNLYFIDFMTKFTFIFLSLTPPPLHTHTPFHWHHFHLVKRVKQHTLKKKKKKCYTQQNGPPRGYLGRVSATTLAAKLSLFLPIWHRTGEEFLHLPSGGMQDKVFLPPKSFLKLKSPTLLNTLNPIFFLSSLLSSRWLRKLCLIQSTRKKLHKM